MSKCDNSIETQHVRELPIDTLDSLADYFYAERVLPDPNTGNMIHSIVKVPGNKLFPTATMDNVTAIEANNTINVPEGQVRACRIVQEASVNKVLLADTTHKAHFLALGTRTGMLLIQNTGFVNIPATHRYIIGAQYYVGADGEPTTSTASGQKLFVPISATKLAMNMN